MWQRVSQYFRIHRYDFKYRVALSGSYIINGITGLFQFFLGCNVSSCQILYMNVIADASAVFGLIIIPKNRQLLSKIIAYLFLVATCSMTGNKLLG